MDTPRGFPTQRLSHLATLACFWRQPGSDGKCLSCVSARSCEHSPRQVAAAGEQDGFCRTRAPSAKWGGSYGLAPPLANARGGGGPGQTASVCLAFQLEPASTHHVKLRRQASKTAEPVTVFVARRGPSAKRGGSYGLAPPLANARGGAVRVRRQVFVSRFSWKQRALTTSSCGGRRARRQSQ